MSGFVKQLRAIDDSSLDPYQFRMIMHIWRVGQSWESLRTLSEKCGMSIGKASAVRNWLIENKWLHYVETDKGRLALEVCSLHEQDCCTCSPHEHGRSPHEHMEKPLPPKKRSPHEPKIEDIPNEVYIPASEAGADYQTKYEEMKSAICTVTKQPVWANNGNLDSLVINLLGEGIESSVIMKEYRDGGWWYEHDWRGKKGQRPTLKAIAETILEAVDKPTSQRVIQAEGGGYNL